MYDVVFDILRWPRGTAGEGNELSDDSIRAPTDHPIVRGPSAHSPETMPLQKDHAAPVESARLESVASGARDVALRFAD